MENKILISVIIPIYNGSKWIKTCFEGILEQNLPEEIGALEVCVCDDASTDETPVLLNRWRDIFHKNNIDFKVFTNTSSSPKGVGFAKNKAVSISKGCYLCFQDVDDLSLPSRIHEQLLSALQLPCNTLLGCQFRRSPENSTARFTEWANSLSNEQLHTQIYTSNGPTVIMPTWFCHKSVFWNVGGFSEAGKGTPEDLIFFYRHLDLGGKIYRVDQCLLVYTYHTNATTFQIDESTIWHIRMCRLEEQVLPQWSNFTIWNAGKQGRKFYNSLSKENQQKVVAFCDVDAKKIGKTYSAYDAKSRCCHRPIEIVHFEKAQAPLVICMKLNMTKNKDFEDNLGKLRLVENVDYILFT